MRFLLILFALITALAAAPVGAQTPMPAPARDSEGHFVGPSETIEAGQGAEETGADVVSGDDSSGDDMMAGEQDAATAVETMAMDGPPQPITLSAKLVDDGPLIPSGVMWRIFSADPSQSGDIALLERSEQATAVFTLKPGHYLAQAAYGFALATDSLKVENAPVARVLVLDAGALRLDARITGGVQIDEKVLSFDIYPQGLQDDARSAVVRNVRPGEMVHLNAGVYHVISRFGAVNAVAETDIRVEQGQLTDATMFHDAAQISLRLVSELGGEAIADVDWTIRDMNDAVVYQFTGTFPSAILAQGDYTVLAQRGGSVYNRDFSVVPGPPHEIEVLTSL